MVLLKFQQKNNFPFKIIKWNLIFRVRRKVTPMEEFLVISSHSLHPLFANAVSISSENSIPMIVPLSRRFSFDFLKFSSERYNFFFFHGTPVRRHVTIEEIRLSARSVGSSAIRGAAEPRVREGEFHPRGVYTRGRRIDRVGVESSITEWQSRAYPPLWKGAPLPFLTRGMDRGGVEGKERKGRCAREGKRWRPRTTGDEANNPLNNTQQIPRDGVFCIFSFSYLLPSSLPLFVMVYPRCRLPTCLATLLCWRWFLAKIEPLNCVIAPALNCHLYLLWWGWRNREPGVCRASQGCIMCVKFKKPIILFEYDYFQVKYALIE